MIDTQFLRKNAHIDYTRVGAVSQDPPAVRENVAVLRLSKALWSRSAAFGKSINPTLNGGHATRRALRPPMRFWFRSATIPRCTHQEPLRVFQELIPTAASAEVRNLTSLIPFRCLANRDFEFASAASREPALFHCSGCYRCLVFQECPVVSPDAIIPG
jgi:hypothetical protein